MSQVGSQSSLMSLDVDEGEQNEGTEQENEAASSERAPEAKAEKPVGCFACIWSTGGLPLTRRARKSKLDDLLKRFQIGKPVFKILGCIPQVLPNIKACGLVLVSPETWRSSSPEIAKILTTPSYNSYRDELVRIGAARLKKREGELQDLQSAKGPTSRVANSLIFAEPFFSNHSLLVGVLVCISVRPGFSMVDREALLMTMHMMSTYHEPKGIRRRKLGRIPSQGTPVPQGVTASAKGSSGDTFVAAFAPSARQRMDITAEKPPRLRRWSYGSAHSGDSLLELVTFEFNPYTKDDKELLDIIMSIIREDDTLKNLNISNDVMYNIVADIQAQYFDVPFHNFRHAYMVMQMCYLLMKESPLLKKVLNRPEQRLALLLAALCHDVSHPGNNNDFEIRTKSEHAMLYSDQSVLENLHCRVAFETMLNYKIDKLMPPAAWRSFRSSIVHAILSTDMKHHNKLKAELYKGLRNPELIQVSDWIAYLVHSADLGNLTLKWEISKEWEEKLFEEFAQQAKKEKARGLQVTPYMSGANAVTKADIQLGFMENILLPWWDALLQLIPQIAPRVATLKRNYARYIAPIDTSGVKLQFQKKMRPRADSFAIPRAPNSKLSTDGLPISEENPFRTFNAY